jgi:N-acyl homoserine lactone hydrolase
MMAAHSIRPLGLSVGPRDLSSYTYRMNMGVPCETACYSWYIDGSDPKTVVDAGIVVPDRQLTTLEEAYKGLGISPEEIEIVILTHLHADHSRLAHRFSKARCLVQKSEWDYAMHPHQFDIHLYEKKHFEGLNIETISGETEIVPGVTVFPTPGHSVGGQSVEVKTSRGKAVISGVCGHLRTFEQTEDMKKKQWEASLPLIHVDVRQCYDSVVRIKHRADIIIANHDVAYLGKDRIP